ncbi:MAG: carbamoyl-phosphate synthase large subunit, partial [Polyangiales bacterium]
QYALDPDSLEYRVIEINARLSRSSALASKATGYPLAYVAAKIGIGYTLPEIPNSITRRTTAFFEPSLDYIVCKAPRWDLTKFQGAAMGIGSEMKSVGEVMSIGRTFPEVIQKALRMLDIGVHGLDPTAFDFEDVRSSIRKATTHRVFAVARGFLEGLTVDEIHELSSIDEWFLSQIERIVRMHVKLRESELPLSSSMLREAKEFGFSDRAIELLVDSPEGSIRNARQEHGIRANSAQIDTMAAEFPADTNYLYTSYHAQHSDVKPSWRKKVLVLGSGPYRIGSSVEFDWCCVSAIQAASDAGYETIMLNYNPETVSTDYDICDRLYFEEISFESVMDLCERERPDGVIVSMGGQIPNNLAFRLHRAGVKILGTSPEDIDRAEDRNKFSALLDQLGVDQPRWMSIVDAGDAEQVVDRLGGFPVLVRPSYVLSGAAMSVAHEPQELNRILSRAAKINPDYPVVVSKFEVHAREIEIDAVGDDGEIVLWAVSEHVEDAGVHSGDATLVLPPQTLYIRTIREIRRIASAIARELRITGPFNMQFLAKLGAVKVIECNLRASRSFPFVSKVTGTNFAAEATNRMLGLKREVSNETLALDYVGVKVPMFSFSRILGADPMIGVEMTSTGEVGCLGADLDEALLHGLLATGFRFPTAGVLVSLGPIADKYSFADEARLIVEELGLPIYATRGTAERLIEVGIECIAVEKEAGGGTSAFDLIDDGRVDLVINIPREYDEQGRPDGYLIRRHAVDAGVPLITDLKLAGAVVEALRSKRPEELSVVACGDYIGRGTVPLS